MILEFNSEDCQSSKESNSSFRRIQLSLAQVIDVDMSRYDMLYFSRLILWWIVLKADNVSLNAGLKVDLQPIKIKSSSQYEMKLYIVNMWPWSTKAVISNTGIFVAIAKNTLYGSKL